MACCEKQIFSASIGQQLIKRSCSYFRLAYICLPSAALRHMWTLSLAQSYWIPLLMYAGRYPIYAEWGMCLQSVLGGASTAGESVSADVINAITTVLKAALPSGITQLADNGELPLQAQIQNAADALTSVAKDGKLPQPPQPTSDEVTSAVKVNSAAWLLAYP